MIAIIEGRLTGLTGEKARIAPGGGLTYELLLPTFTVARLGGSIGQTVALHTLHFLESNNQGATFFPRLAGFLTEQDKAFFELFVTCKGIGYRKALRAMALPAAQLAAAIEDRDLVTLQSLPEVGKRTAETLAATLRGKVDRFLTTPSAPGTPGIPESSIPAHAAGGIDGSAQASAPPRSSAAREALEALVMLGEKRIDALRWIDQVLADHEAQTPQAAPRDAQAIITAVYRIKGL